MKLEPYLFFEGRAEEAIEFYKRALGAEVTAMFRMDESPEPPPPGMLPPGSEKKIMHANLKVGDMMMMISDGMASGKPDFKGISLSLSGLTVAETDRIFAALSEGGNVRMPLGKTFFSPRFGMVADRFGVGWMVMADPA
jgi:PhnB protein